VDGSTDVFQGDPGGKIVLYESKEPGAKLKKLATIDTKKPYGMHYVPGEGLYFVAGDQCKGEASPGNERILRINPYGKLDLEIRSQLFSNLRSVKRTQQGILVSASGIDALLEYDLNGNLIWDWWATDSAYPFLQNGEIREIRKDTNHSSVVYPTQSQTTHINSGIEDPNNPQKILASLFHQNEIVAIDKETKELEVLLSNLKRPHHIRPQEGGFIVSNTRGGTVLVIDENFDVIQEIEGNTKDPYFKRWIQDAIMTDRSSFLIADAMNFRLVEQLRDKKYTYRIGAPNRVFQLEEVPEEFELSDVVIKE